MKLSPLFYYKDHIKMVDQRKLPLELSYVICRDQRDIYKAIKEMKIRGAPAIGTAAAFGLWLGIKKYKKDDKKEFLRQVNKTSVFLASSRPTAVNLSWALERIQKIIKKNISLPIPKIKELVFKEAVEILKDDRERCRRMGNFGAQYIKDKDTCLTICNAGAMATSGFGTALGVFFAAKDKKKKFKVVACETRPLLQGARITLWELKQKKINATLICDSMAASLMEQKKISKVFVGADRIALNGDAANKIGTYNLAVLAKFHRIPFYVVAPLSTFDSKIKTGKDIPIEYRKADEVTSLHFKKRVAPFGIKVLNPAFDVTKNNLIAAIITEKGVIKPPYKSSIKKILLAK